MILFRKATIRIAVVLLLAVPSRSRAQISAVNQKSDLKQLYESLVKTHPGFDRYVSREDLRSQYGLLEKSITGPATNWQFYRLASRMAAAVKCGHTRLRPSSSMSEEAVGFFPLAAAFAKGHMYVRLKDQTVKEVLSVNDLSVDDMLEKIFQATPVDGNADEGKFDLIAASFPIHYARYVDHNPTSFKLVLKDGAASIEKNFEPLPLVQASNLSMKGRNPEVPIDYQISSGVGYLGVMTFSSEEYRNAGVSYNDFLSTTFRKMKESGIRKLVVDIRDNGGGDDQYGANLCRYLLNTQFSYFRTVKERDVNGQFHAVDHPCLAKQPIAADAFKGDVVLLINGRTFSTAADVAAVFKNSRRGTVIGYETSGGYEGNTSGRSTTITLKNSGLTITIPLWYYENEVVPQKYAHRGVLPDVAITPTIETLNAGKDAALNAAIELLQKRN